MPNGILIGFTHRSSIASLSYELTPFELVSTIFILFLSANFSHRAGHFIGSLLSGVTCIYHPFVLCICICVFCIGDTILCSEMQRNECMPFPTHIAYQLKFACVWLGPLIRVNTKCSEMSTYPFPLTLLTNWSLLASGLACVWLGPLNRVNPKHKRNRTRIFQNIVLIKRKSRKVGANRMAKQREDLRSLHLV